MWSQVRRFVARGQVAALCWALVVAAGVLPGGCSIDDRELGVAVDRQRPSELVCLEAGCPADDACRDYPDAPAGGRADAGCLTVDDCPFTWKPAARDGEACRCDDAGCLLLFGASCSVPAACDGGSCVATAEGNSVCCAQACAPTEVCAPDGSACVPAEPCTEGRRCSGALHQSCVNGVWETLTDCAALGCSSELDGCLRSAGQACETDSQCGEGSCLATADGNRICCTGACGTSCQRCAPEGTACVSVDDDDACGELACPTDPCRVYDPATVVANRCSEGRCATPAEVCTVFQPQRAELECSATALCDAEGSCALPKRELLGACGSNEQCASGACVAGAAGTSVCCSRQCAASEVCGATGACEPAPVCETGAAQCSGSNFQRCSAGQWVTELACGALGCSVQREGCFAGAGQECGSDADCGQGTCQETAAGGSVCCTAACDGACRVCSATGTACTNLQDDAACGAILCPADTVCRNFPPSVGAGRCVAGACGSAAQLCAGTPRNAGQPCSALNLCDGAGNCSEPKKGNGDACGVAGECASGNCVDGVCCNSACNGVCEECSTGFCGAAATDTACGAVTCSNFDADCVTSTQNFLNVCSGRNDCRSVEDCGFRSANTRCGRGGLCDGAGNCAGPSVECGTQTCSGADVCCSGLNVVTGVQAIGCGDGTVCDLPNGGPGPVFVITCDQNADCVGDQVCCMVGNNVNSGEISCREECTAEAVGAELGAPPEMLVVGQLCASQEGPLVLGCPPGQVCSAVVDTLPPAFRACR